MEAAVTEPSIMSAELSNVTEKLPKTGSTGAGPGMTSDAVKFSLSVTMVAFAATDEYAIASTHAHADHINLKSITVPERLLR